MLTFVLIRGACSQDELHSALGFVNITLSSLLQGTQRVAGSGLLETNWVFVTLIVHNCLSGCDCSLVHRIPISQMGFLVCRGGSVRSELRAERQSSTLSASGTAILAAQLRALLLAESLSASEEALCSIDLDNLNKKMGLLTNKHQKILNMVSKKDVSSFRF